MPWGSLANEEETDVGEDGGMVLLPLFNIEVLRDEKDATVAMVFTRGEKVGGTVNVDEIIEDPLEAAKRIFVRKVSKESGETMSHGFELLQKGGVEASVYQQVIRTNLCKLLRDHGFKVETNQSVDGDEILMKICVPRDGDVLATWAHNNNYPVPVKPSMYSNLAPEGYFYPGGKPPTNDDEDDVVAYVEYDKSFAEEHAGMLEPFREVDEIRLIMTHLDHYLNLNELQDQNIISRFFYCSKYQTKMHMYEKWAKVRNFWHMPNHHDDEMLRDFFGEQITFLFSFLAYFTRAMGFLGVFGLLSFVLIRSPFVELFGFTAANRETIQLGYIVVNIAWAAFFMLLWKASQKRRVQKWGMDVGASNVNLELSNYDPDLEGTKDLRWRKSVANFGKVFFLLFFVTGVAAIQAIKRVARETGATDMSPLLLTIHMQGSMFIWGKVAPHLVTMQNHRTVIRWYDALAQFLALIKMFIAIWPGFGSSFITKWLSLQCDASRDDVLWKVYEKIGWPEGLDVNPIKRGNITVLSDTSWADPFLYVNHDGETCMFGCFPMVCEHVGVDKVLFCQTNCVVEYQAVLQTFFIVQIVSIIIGMLIPIVLVKWVVHGEVSKSEQMRQEGEGGSDRPYSLLQVQAKREELCPYEYKSWGASLVEDFEQIATTFIVVVCYGQLNAIVVFMGFLAHMLVYRLLAMRMLLVTGRPFPAGADGIGFWQEAMDLACNIGILTNIGLLCFVAMPFRDWDLADQVMLFLVLEHCIIVTRMLIDQIIKGDPDDVRLAADINHTFLKKMEVYETLRVYPRERYSYDDTHACLGLPPPKVPYADFEASDKKK